MSVPSIIEPGKRRKRPEPPEPIKVKKTYVGLVIDGSGSMAPFKTDTIGGVNTLIKETQENGDLAGDTRMTLVSFGERDYGNAPRVIMQNEMPGEIALLTDESYNPAGGTALLDGIGMMIEILEPFDKEDEDISFLVTIFTDGMENASREWINGRLKEKLKTLQEKENWTFTLIGANVSLDQLAEMTGINRGSTISYVATNEGTQNAFASASAGAANYFAGRAAGVRGMSVSDIYEGAQDLSNAGVSGGLRVNSMKNVARARADLEKLKGAAAPLVDAIKKADEEGKKKRSRPKKNSTPK